ncbi:MAG: glycosyltransferase [Planctomycetes bacterium]|nr:glycosyltransferase [Planctomycetota bacterium]
MSGPAQEKPGILWIGRMLFDTHLRVREVELARNLLDRARIYALDRSEAIATHDNSLRSRLRLRRRLLMSRFAVTDQGELTRFRMPVAAATGPVFNRIAAWWNNRRINEALAHFRCGHVFHGNPFFFMPEPPQRRRYRVHFDVIDNFYDEWSDGFVGRARKRFLREAMRRADTFTACSHSLCEYAERITGRRAAYAPNGAPVQRLRAVQAHEANALRERLGLQDRFVIGFIGNHRMDFDGMEMLLDAWVPAHKARPELALLIVGPGSDKVAGPCGLGAAQGIHAVGPIPPDQVATYFHACNGGVHPYVPRPLTEDATPLNVVEFSVVGRPMLCNPLKELRRLALPNIRFAEANAPAWTSALLDPATFGSFDRGALVNAVTPFDWALSAQALAREMGL